MAFITSPSSFALPRKPANPVDGIGTEMVETVEKVDSAGPRHLKKALKNAVFLEIIRAGRCNI
jgi:hypothetical protein